MDGSRSCPVGTGLGGFGYGGLGTVGSGSVSVGTGQGFVGTGQGLVGTGSGMVIAGIGMAGTGIGTGSGDAAGSVGSGIGRQFPSGSQTLAGAIDPNLLLAQQHSASGGYAGRVSVKTPVFYRSNPGVWFRQLEYQFVLAGITNDETEFHHILAAIPEDVPINPPMGIDNYRDIRDHICGNFQNSKQEMIEEALGMISLDVQKPSLCLMRIQQKLAECNLTLDDKVIKHRLMQAMPVSVKTALSAHLELPVELFAKLADTFYSNTAVAISPQNVFAASTQRMPTRPLYNQHSTKNNQSINHSKSNRSIENTHRPFTACRRPKICNYHLKKQNHLNYGVNGQDRSPKIKNQRLAQTPQQIRQTSNP